MAEHCCTLQISRELKLFAKALDLTACAAYGGSQVKEQINELKRGVHAVVCTPGRMIDILVTSNGKITNLRRVTMLVIDEADRMFDMGFEPQIMRIIAQIRPDRQAILFSATFPYAVEAVARDLLTDPVAIQVRALVPGAHASCTPAVPRRPERCRRPGLKSPHLIGLRFAALRIGCACRA